MNYYNGTYQSSILDSIQSLFYKVWGYVPNIVAAVIVLILGWLVAIFLGRVVYEILKAIKIDALANRLGMDRLSQRVGREFSIARFGQWLVKWFFIIATILAASDILGLVEVSNFLMGSILPYFGHVLAAVVVLLLGVIAANFLGDIVRGALHAGEMRYGDTMAAVTRWAILIFAVLIALSELQIGSAFLQDLFRGVVAMLAIAGGLAFGLGGKDHAKKVLDVVERDLTTRR